MLSAIRRIKMAINRVAEWTDSHGFSFSMEKYHVVLFVRTQLVFLIPSKVVLYFGLSGPFLWYDLRRASDMGPPSQVTASFMLNSF